MRRFERKMCEVMLPMLMLCEKATIERAKELVKTGEWVIEQKFDGVRACIRGGRLFDRRGVDITERFPEFVGLQEFKMDYDGEIVAQSGEFNDVSGRMHLRDKFMMRMLAKRNPAKLVIFDVIGEYQLNPLDARREVLEKTNFSKYSWIEVAKRYAAEEIDCLWESIVKEGKEGLVIKRRDAAYQGKRSLDWLKVKAFVEEMAVFVRYEEHPRGITVETADGRRVVVNGRQSDAVKKRIDADGKVIAEIQYLPQNGSDAWRFPSFRKVV